MVNNLAGIISNHIRKEGPISFHDYMELCLYHPDHGYYTSSSARIGKQGDFFTTSSMNPVFGAMIGRQLEQIWELLGREPMSVVEYGAGTGALCRDILDYLKKNAALFEGLTYFIIEKSQSMRARQQAMLTERVEWINSLRDIAPVNGCILSNEVVDNFSFHRVKMVSELMEVFVDYDTAFKEILEPASQKLCNYFKELGVSLPEGQDAEVNLEAIDWITEIGARLNKGYVMTIDYGYPSEELYAAQRKRGTWMCYHQHEINDQPYQHIGGQDITAHVNFSAIANWGAGTGLVSEGLVSQAGFLIAMGWEEHLQQLFQNGKDAYTNYRQYASLKHTVLIEMGRKFNILFQSKGMEGQVLRGLHPEMTLAI